MPQTIHCCITKAGLVADIRKHGARSVLANLAEGVTDGDVLAEIEADPREYFVFGSCDNQTDEGRCGGHGDPSVPATEPSMDEAESQGTEAARTGKALGDNPYPLEDERHEAWEDAFIDSAYDQQAVEPEHLRDLSKVRP